MKTYRFIHPTEAHFLVVKCDSLTFEKYGDIYYWQCMLDDKIVAQFPFTYSMIYQDVN